MKIDTKAQLIIADLVVYIIVFMIIIAIITTLTIALDRKESEIINNQEYDMIAQNTINALIKSTGTPTNWDKTPTSNIKMIGLRSNETTNMISYMKLVKLKQNPQLMNKLLDYNIAYELTLKDVQNPQNTEIIIKSHHNQNNKNIYTKDAIVKLDYGYNITQIKTQTNIICPMNHTQNYECMPITVENSTLRDGSYYLLSNCSNNYYIIENSHNENTTGQMVNDTINQKIASLMNNVNETLYFHVNSGGGDVYLIYDVNNIKPNYENITTKTHILTLKIY